MIAILIDLQSNAFLLMIYIYLQEGYQAIHTAASAGHLHIVKALVQEYNVLPTAETNVSQCKTYIILGVHNYNNYIILAI